MSDVRYWLNQYAAVLRHCTAWSTNMEEKQTELETENK